jgi:hypothetical protein
MKKYFITILALIFVPILSARINETLEECSERYGRPLAVATDKTIALFVKGDFFIQAEYHQGTAYRIVFAQCADAKIELARLSKWSLAFTRVQDSPDYSADSDYMEKDVAALHTLFKLIRKMPISSEGLDLLLKANAGDREWVKRPHEQGLQDLIFETKDKEFRAYMTSDDRDWWRQSDAPRPSHSSILTISSAVVMDMLIKSEKERVQKRRHDDASKTLIGF